MNTLDKLGRLAYKLALPAIRLVIGRTNRVYLVLAAQGQILMVKNRLSGQKWQLPGGGMKAGENPIRTLRRELREETGINLEGAKLTLIQSGRWQTDRLGHAYKIYLTSLPVQPKLKKIQAELVELAWLKPIELKPANTHAEILAALKSARLV